MSVRRGGMTIRFIQGSEQSSDNKYVRFDYMDTSTAITDFTDVANWQGVNVEIKKLDNVSETSNSSLNESVDFVSDDETETFARIDKEGITTKDVKIGDKSIKDILDNIETKSDSLKEEQKWTSDDETETFARIDSKGIHATQFLDMYGDRIDQYSINLPEYYKSYISEKIIKLNTSVINAGFKTDHFIFITDTHWADNNKMVSPLLVKHLLCLTDYKKVFFGGDYLGGNLSDDEHIGMAMAMKHKRIVDDIANYGKVYQIRGNHDFWGYSEALIDVNGLDNVEVSNVVMYPLNDNIITNPNNTTKGSYYYMDNKQCKLRYIFIDQFDITINIHDGDWDNNKVYGISNEEYAWVISQAILTTPSEYKIVFIGHCAPLPYFEIAYYYSFANLISGINKKTEVTINGVTYDFTSFTPDVIAFIAGHLHEDEVAYKDGACYITTRADGWAGAVNTIKEQAFDMYSVGNENETINVERIGYGKNRYMHLNAAYLNIGETYTIVATKIVAVTYGCYDSDNGTYNNKINTHVTINDNIVTGVSAGEITCYAEDSEGNREYFNIVIN